MAIRPYREFLATGHRQPTYGQAPVPARSRIQRAKGTHLCESSSRVGAGSERVQFSERKPRIPDERTYNFTPARLASARAESRTLTADREFHEGRV